ncbi:MAG: putative homoserine kinase type II (protein kinase fold) [Spirochaetes bacterium]|nr:MAG: putative homoserine kinase type II (protein kinase fold) [Spirochaetota bacterium]
MSGVFDALSPETVLQAVEMAFGLAPDGSLFPYSSYVNRVYGFGDESGNSYVVKFYRPNRWTPEAILEEHRFLKDCAEAELPVVAPLPDLWGETLPAIELEDGSTLFNFALFPKRGGRNFEPTSDEDWLRLGSLTGRLHAVGARRPALARSRLGPELAKANLGTLQNLIHPEFTQDFTKLCASLIDSTAQEVSSIPAQRIHGDLHRGNILERPGEGLAILDFDDMVLGPPIQDLWLLLPGDAAESAKELSLLIEGYSEFLSLAPGSVALIETLRFYRMLHFLAWRSLQRGDAWFAKDFPDWGGRAFWLRELEDFRRQAEAISAAN